MYRHSLFIRVALLLIACLVSVSGARSQASATKGSIAFDVTWKLTGSGYGGYINLEFQARYTARKLGYPLDCVLEWTSMIPHAGIKECYLLSYENGRLVKGEGHMDPDPQPAVFEDTGCPSDSPPAINTQCAHAPGRPTPQEIAAIHAGYVFVDKEGTGEFLLQKGPAYKTDGNGEAASSCLLLDKFPHLSFTGLIPGNLYKLHQKWQDTRSFEADVPDCKSNITIEIQASCMGVNALDLFSSMMPAFAHPRCLNCHGVVDPLTGANHGGGKVDAGPQDNNRGITTPMGNGVCLDCHTALARKDGFGRETGPWRLAPALMSFVGKGAKALCEQVKDFGFPDPTDPRLSMDFFRRHVADDDLIGLGFEGLSGGAAKKSKPPPMNRQQFVTHAMKWATQGQHECGCVATAEIP